MNAKAIRAPDRGSSPTTILQTAGLEPSDRALVAIVQLIKQLAADLSAAAARAERGSPEADEALRLAELQLRVCSNLKCIARERRAGKDP